MEETFPCDKCGKTIGWQEAHFLDDDEFVFCHSCFDDKCAEAEFRAESAEEDRFMDEQREVKNG